MENSTSLVPTFSLTMPIAMSNNVMRNWWKQEIFYNILHRNMILMAYWLNTSINEFGKFIELFASAFFIKSIIYFLNTKHPIASFIIISSIFHKIVTS